MARIRTIKPEFWTSAQVMDCSPNARLLFLGMLNFADDAGRMTFSPKTLKAQIYPSDDITTDDVARMLGELSTNGLIIIYSVEGKEFIGITGWHHQKIDKPRASKLPAPIVEASSKHRRKVATDLILSKGKVSEGKGSKLYRADALESDWPSDEFEQFWQAFPKRTEKLAAQKKLATIKKSGSVPFAELMAGVRRYAAAVKDTDSQYIKNPAAWLNAGRWADETQPGASHGNRTANQGTTGHAAILAAASREAGKIAGNGAMAGSGREAEFPFGNGTDGNGPAVDRGPDGGTGSDLHGLESRGERVLEGEIIAPDKIAAGLSHGGRNH